MTTKICVASKSKYKYLFIWRALPNYKHNGDTFFKTMQKKSMTYEDV